MAKAKKSTPKHKPASFKHDGPSKYSCVACGHEMPANAPQCLACGHDADVTKVRNGK